jgi:hypothetical protein
MAFNLDMKFIELLEKELNAILPLEYKDEMAISNGGVIFIDDEDWEIFPIKDTTSKKRLSRTINDITYENKKMAKWKFFSSYYLGIASNGMGDVLILNKDDDNYKNEIYIWKHETGEIYKVANSFSELEIE